MFWRPRRTRSGGSQPTQPRVGVDPRADHGAGGDAVVVVLRATLGMASLGQDRGDLRARLGEPGRQSLEHPVLPGQTLLVDDQGDVHRGRVLGA